MRAVIADDVFDRPLRRHRLAVFLDDPGHVLLCAVAENAVIGQLRAIIHHHPDRPDDCYVDNLGVAPDWKRRGVATALWREARRIAEEKACRDIWVATEADNAEALGFYARMGLEECATSVFEARLKARLKA